MKQFEQIIEDYHKKVAQGTSQDEVISSLHAQGISIIESIKIVRALHRVNLHDAKLIVTAHPIWADFVRSWEPIHAALLDELEKEAYER